MLKPVALIAAMALASVAAAADAPPMPVRHILQTGPASGAPREQIVTADVVFAPGARLPFHTHPGEEAAVVVSGALTLEIEGKPAQTFKAGDSFIVPRGVPHQATAAQGETHVIATYVVDKDQPLVTLRP
jgi:quercetin dioxygenase-like cupin family protein